MAYLGIKLSSNCTKELSAKISQINFNGKGVSRSDYHITILSFSDNWAINDFWRSVDVVHTTLLDSLPINFTINKISSFETKPESTTPIVALVKSNGLNQLFEKLSQAFDSAYIPYNKVHKSYVPHITVGYSNHKLSIFESIPKIKSGTAKIILCGGDSQYNRVTMSFNLPSDENLIIEQRRNLMEKFDKNPVEYLTQTSERRVNLR